MNGALLGAALAAGFLSSGHCMGMCGGIVGALQLTGTGAGSPFFLALLYNAGRLVTYGLLGALAGAAGSAFGLADNLRGVSAGLLIASDFFILLVGLGFAGVLPGLSRKLELPVPHRFFGRVLSRLARFPAPLKAFLPGVLFGLLPCGLLYAMLLLASQQTGALSGALYMAAFGLGTVPALQLFAGGAHWLKRGLRGTMAKGAGALIVLIGGWNLLRHLQMTGLAG